MLRRILWIVAVIALIVGGWFLYRQVTGKSPLGSGDVAWRNPPADPNATTDIDGHANDGATTTFDRNAPPPGGASNQPPPAMKAPVAQDGTDTGIMSPAVPMGSSSAMTGSSTMAAPAGPIPVGDSQSANAPNGMRFGGASRFQWYRQGNITYRIDTVSGTSCVAFATNAEWRKAEVLQNGCNSHS